MFLYLLLLFPQADPAFELEKKRHEAVIAFQKAVVEVAEVGIWVVVSAVSLSELVSVVS